MKNLLKILLLLGASFLLGWSCCYQRTMRRAIDARVAHYDLATGELDFVDGRSWWNAQAGEAGVIREVGR